MTNCFMKVSMNVLFPKSVSTQRMIEEGSEMSNELRLQLHGKEFDVIEKQLQEKDNQLEALADVSNESEPPPQTPPQVAQCTTIGMNISFTLHS